MRFSGEAARGIELKSSPLLLFGALATTRHWNTIVAMVRILKGERKRA